MLRVQLPFSLPRWCTFCVRFVGAVVAPWGGAFAAFLAVPGKLGPNTHIGGAKRANWAPTIEPKTQRAIAPAVELRGTRVQPDSGRSNVIFS